MIWEFVMGNNTNKNITLPYISQIHKCIDPIVIQQYLNMYKLKFEIKNSKDKFKFRKIEHKIEIDSDSDSDCETSSEIENYNIPMNIFIKKYHNLIRTLIREDAKIMFKPVRTYFFSLCVGALISEFINPHRCDLEKGYTIGILTTSAVYFLVEKFIVIGYK